MVVMILLWINQLKEVELPLGFPPQAINNQRANASSTINTHTHWDTVQDPFRRLICECCSVEGEEREVSYGHLLFVIQSLTGVKDNIWTEIFLASLSMFWRRNNEGHVASKSLIYCNNCASQKENKEKADDIDQHAAIRNLISSIQHQNKIKWTLAWCYAECYDNLPLKYHVSLFSVWWCNWVSTTTLQNTDNGQFC